MPPRAKRHATSARPHRVDLVTDSAFRRACVRTLRARLERMHANGMHILFLQGSCSADFAGVLKEAIECPGSEIPMVVACVE
jgi:hypothetical protein